VCDSISEVIFNLLDFGDVASLVWHLLTTLIRTGGRQRARVLPSRLH
jgi:hypothetical protein